MGRIEQNRLLTPKVGYLGNSAVCPGPQANDWFFNALKLILNYSNSYLVNSYLRCPVTWKLCGDISAKEFLSVKPVCSVLGAYTSLFNHNTKKSSGTFGLVHFPRF